MKIESIMFVLGIVLIPASALEKRCDLSQDGLLLILTIRQEASASAEQIEAIDVLTGATSSCQSTMRTESEVVVHELSIYVAIDTRIQQSPTVETSDCYITTSATTTSLSVVVQRQAGVSFATDFVYLISCDSRNVPVPVASIGGVAVTNVLPTGTVPERTESVTAMLIGTNNEVYTSGNVGDQVKLRVIYIIELGSVDGEYAVAIRIYDVKVAGSAAFAPSFELITTLGCLATDIKVSQFGLTDSMVFNSVESTPTTKVFDSGLFTIAMFSGPSPKLFFTSFSYEAACVTLLNNKCVNQQQYCIDNALTRRRKRNADTPINGTAGSLQFSIPFKLSGDSTDSQGMQNAGTSNISGEAECQFPDMYWIISLVLGVLLFVVMAVSVFLALRLRREQHFINKTAENSGHRNPGYY